MDSEVSQKIKKIKKSNWPYYTKSSVCKLSMSREEAFGELKDAIEFCKMAIHYESLISPSWSGQEIEIKGLKRHLKYIQKKSNHEKE